MRLRSLVACGLAAVALTSCSFGGNPDEVKEKLESNGYTISRNLSRFFAPMVSHPKLVMALTRNSFEKER